MSVGYSNNSVTDALVEHGRPGDVFAMDYFGHRHGESGSLRADGNAQTFRDGFAGDYRVLNSPDRLKWLTGSVFNRSHIKAYAVGNRVLSLGGVNCGDYFFHGNLDLMADFESAVFVDFLRKFIENNGNLRAEGPGRRIALDDGTDEIIIDYGRKRQSLILTSLLTDLGGSFERATLSSCYAPYGRVDRILGRALKRGQQVRFFANSADKFRLPKHSRAEKYTQRLWARAVETPWRDLNPERFNHMKAAVIDYANGRRITYVGSHNFHEVPVACGTAEVALRSTDPELAAAVEARILAGLAYQEEDARTEVKVGQGALQGTLSTDHEAAW